MILALAVRLQKDAAILNPGSRKSLNNGQIRHYRNRDRPELNHAYPAVSDNLRLRELCRVHARQIVSQHQPAGISVDRNNRLTDSSLPELRISATHEHQNRKEE